MTDVNIPLLRKAVEWAEVEAELGSAGAWDQTFWILPTDTQDPNLDGDAPVSQQFLDRLRGESACGTKFCIAGWVVHASGQRVPWYDASCLAAEALGIEPTQASVLFSADNSIEDVRRIAEDIAGERL